MTERYEVCGHELTEVAKDKWQHNANGLYISIHPEVRMNAFDITTFGTPIPGLFGGVVTLHGAKVAEVRQLRIKSDIATLLNEQARAKLSELSRLLAWAALP